jgi:hypothetical protein
MWRAEDLARLEATLQQAAAGNPMDASIATWNAKAVQDTVRPISYIRWRYKGTRSGAGWGRARASATSTAAAGSRIRSQGW